MKRFTIFLKDGRVATAEGTKFSPDADRPFQGQARNFVIVASDTDEVAAFLSQEVVGWSSEEVETAAVNQPVALVPGTEDVEPDELEPWKQYRQAV